MKFHWYEKKQKTCQTEFISEGEFHFVKKIGTAVKDKK